MEYRRLGTTDLRVSVVGLGCWAIGGEVDVWGPVDDNESIAAIQQGLDSGINLIDTAPAYGYGHSEEIVGKALAGRRDEVIVATKCGLVWKSPGARLERSLDPRSIARECEASLRRLRVECIDLYQIHWPDPATPLNQTMEAMIRLRQQGKVRAIGVSNFSCEQLAEARRFVAVDCVQPELSLLEQSATEDLLPYCREYGLGVLCYGPLARGLLTGKFSSASRFSDLRARDARFAGTAMERNLRVVEGLRAIASTLECTPAQLALRWVVQQPGITAALAGFKRPSQVMENAHAGDMTIPRAFMDDINALPA